VWPNYLEAASTDQPEPDRLTIDRLYSLPHLIGTAPSGFVWSPDSRQLAFVWNDSGFNFRDVWMIDIEDPELEPRRWTTMPQIERPTPDAFEDPVALAEAEENWEHDRGVSALAWHPDGSHLVVSFHGDLWQVSSHTEPQRLTETASPERQAAYSPDGALLTYIREGEIWTLDSSGQETRRTALAEPDLDLVGFHWSPDGAQLAILQQDETDVSLRGIPDYLTEETTLREVRRAYPGEAPVRRRLGVIEPTKSLIESDAVGWIDWGETEPDMVLGYRWSPDGRMIAIDTSDLYAKDRQIFIVDLEEGKALRPRRVARDLDPENETFYYWRIAWAKDSERLYFLSDRDEDYHVWAIDPSGDAEPQRWTQGAWAVAEMYPVDEGLVVMGNRGRPEERQIFHVAQYILRARRCRRSCC
jgi:dipeptidyl-peptidase-4